MKFLAQSQDLLGGGQIVGAIKDQLLTICPRCRKKKFYFGLQSGRSQCKGGDCGIKFNSVYSLEKFITSVAYKPYLTVMSSSQGGLDVWRGETEDAQPAWDVPKTRNYLATRGLSRGTTEKENLWAMQNSGTLIVPVHNFFSGGTTPYYRFMSGPLRWVGEGGFERVHHCFMGQVLASKMGENKSSNLPLSNRGVVVVVEGIFDLLSTGLADWGIATLGAEYSVFLMAFLKNHFSSIYHLPDNDSAGKASAKKLGSLCQSYGIPYINYAEEFKIYRGHKNCKDPGDLGETDEIMELRCELEEMNE